MAISGPIALSALILGIHSTGRVQVAAWVVFGLAFLVTMLEALAEGTS